MVYPAFHGPAGGGDAGQTIWDDWDESEVLFSSTGVQTIMGQALGDQRRFLDRVDQAHPTVDSQNAKLVTALGNVCSATEQLPTSAVLSTGLQIPDNVAVAFGGFGDVWKAKYHDGPVAVKVLRIYSAQNLKEAKEILWKQVPMWMRLSHENVAAFRGINTNALSQLALVYDWGGDNIIQYMESHPTSSRLSLLLQIAKGLQYLHKLDIPHGNLKGTNVVIDLEGHARLTDYGLASINSNPRFTVSGTPGAIRASRWLAPEIMDSSRDGDGMLVVESKPADVYSFGVLAYEIFTGTPPFKEQTHAKAAFRTLMGDRPEFPQNAEDVGLTIHMWELLQRCWHQDPIRRPTVEEIIRKLQKFIEHDNRYDEKTRSAAEPTPTISCPRVKSEAPQPNAGAPNRRKRWFCALF